MHKLGKANYIVHNKLYCNLICMYEKQTDTDQDHVLTLETSSAAASRCVCKDRFLS